MTPARLRLLSAGAAKGVVQALAPRFEAQTGSPIEATFDAAGAIRDALLGGAACDAVILPAAMLAALAVQERIDAASIAPLGAVPTGIAVASGDRMPRVATRDELRASLLGATALYCPDTARATAGIHFAGVLRALGIAEACAARLRPHPNGASAMAALAALGARGAVGCTQASEILYTPGVAFVAPLPPPFELATVYAVGVSRNADNAQAAQAFAARIAADETQALRRAAGFVDAST